jgi:hypothetical protein
MIVNDELERISKGESSCSILYYTTIYMAELKKIIAVRITSLKA